MKRLSKYFLSFISILFSIALFSCSNSPAEKEIYKNSYEEEATLIGDEVIYGNEFSLSTIFESQIRSAEISDENLTEMVYFSVCPTTVESIYEINNTIGYLNPVELNKEIIQACDAESLIFKKQESLTDVKIEDLFQIGIKYYYIEPKQKAEAEYTNLEGYEIIDEFQMSNELEEDDSEEELDEDFDSDEISSEGSRWLWTKYKVCGNVYYKINGQKIPAYGIRVRRGLEKSDTTSEDGKFSLGSVAKCWLTWIWIDYNNEACSLSNIAGISASTLIKVDFPNKLNKINLNANSGYSNGKMAICNELLRRKKRETPSNFPKAIVWTTQLGTGTSSAPSFNYQYKNGSPDIFITNCDNFTPESLITVHHEYTHFMHVVFAENKNKFWKSITDSEIVSSITGIINMKPYDFSNKYVCFTENLAEWYSYVAASQGAYTPNTSEKKFNNTGTYKGRNFLFDNTEVFTDLCTNNVLLSDSEASSETTPKSLQAERIIRLIKKDKITTFQEFYDSLVKTYPQKKSAIRKAFSDNYNPYGNSIKY